MNDVCEGGPPLNLAPLKGRARAEVKAQNEYADKTAPCYSWLFDIVRGSVLRPRGRAGRALEKDRGGPAHRNRPDKNFNLRTLFNGYRDIMMNVAVEVDTRRREDIAPLRAPARRLSRVGAQEPRRGGFFSIVLFGPRGGGRAAAGHVLRAASRRR